MDNRSLLEVKENIDNITEEAPKRVSSANSFLKRWVTIPLPQYKMMKSKTASVFLYILGIIGTLLIPFYMHFAMEYIHWGSFGACFDYLKFYGGSAIFASLVLFGVYTVLWLIFKKGFVASFIFIVLCAALAVTNYFKHTLTGDFVYPWDIIHQTGNIGELSGFVKTGLPPKYLLVLIIGFILPVGSFFFHSEIPLKFFWRLVLAGVIFLFMFFSFNTPQKVSDTLGKFNMQLNSTAAQETNHIVNGFTGGFIVNCLSMNVAEPEGYSEEKIEEIMENYEGTSQSEDFSSPDIIVVLSESFWDPRLLPDTEFSKNPMKNYDEISQRQNARAGYMYQTAFGGGTVRTEFEVITGLSSDYLPVGAVPWQYISKDTPTYATSYKALGYRTVFMHTYVPSFYLRQRTYPHLSFDEMYFQEDLIGIEEIPWHVSGSYVSDSNFVDYIEYLLEKEDKPCFLFGISMENHQPYENKYPDPAVKVTNDKLSDAAHLSVENYTTGVYMADQALLKLVNYIDSRDKDTILVYFGDHLPTLGADKAAYKETGFIDKDEITDDQWKAIMRTPFLIYSNFPLKESKMLKQGNDNSISSYNLLNATADMIGAPKTPFMQLLSDYAEAIPYYNARLKIEPNKEQQYFINAHGYITYDIMCGERYMVK